MDTTTIEYAVFDSPPFVSDTWIADRLADECATLPEAFRTALTEVLQSVDNMRCARCLDPAGFVLAENAEGYERLEWRTTGLARHGSGPVSVLCEECTPYLPTTESEEDGR